ncbi:MAG TPA: DUF2931 family protein [Scandinavium sp.]|jgi:hypothetical protein|uniref:DUF2931 family protein n=1 Tax=Scandinavium sp. TaxID=2830653 RepID=UPI002E32B7FB|nr:DUF2931 family protein [Scandinavium sp.]HEX4501756.1 DUF2931 family protein [Scandinavium sp.]
MKRTRVIFAILFLALSGCHSGVPTTPEETGEMPYGKWGFAFFTPKALPARVTYVGIIDAKKILYSFSNLDKTENDSESSGKWNKRYTRFAQFNKALHPPVVMMFCWDSIIDKKTYETRVTFSESLRKRMSLSSGKSRYAETIWYSTLLFGLAPGGTVKIWLQKNRGGGENLPVEPQKITTLSGDKLDGCKGITLANFDYDIPDGYTQETKDAIKGKTYPYGDW